MQLPRKFKERYENLVDDPELFFETLLKPLPKSFRINTLKVKEVNLSFNTKQVPWYKDAYVSENPRLGDTIEHFLGYIYSQELTSMLPPLIVKKELESAETVLDCCAAPGSKTTQIAAIMKNQGKIIANDMDYRRIKALKFNIEKTGALNAIITNEDLLKFKKAQYDVVLLDAPCSTEGTIRKNFKILRMWSEKFIKKHSKLQKKLILKAYELTKPGGVLIYSTCTFAPEENEEVIDFLLNNTDAKLENITIKGLKTVKGLTNYNKKEFTKEVEKTIRIWPHHNDTDGFYLAKIRK